MLCQTQFPVLFWIIEFEEGQRGDILMVQRTDRWGRMTLVPEKGKAKRSPFQVIEAKASPHLS